MSRPGSPAEINSSAASVDRRQIDSRNPDTLDDRPLFALELTRHVAYPRCVSLHLRSDYEQTSFDAYRIFRGRKAQISQRLVHLVVAAQHFTNAGAQTDVNMRVVPTQCAVVGNSLSRHSLWVSRCPRSQCKCPPQALFSTLYAGLLLPGSRFFERKTPLALRTVGIPGMYRCSTES